MPTIEQIQRLAVALGGDAGDERRVGHLGVPGCVARLARTLDLYGGWWRLLRGSATTRTSFKEDGKRLWVTRRLGGTRPGPAIRGGARTASTRPAGVGRLVGDPWIALPGRVRLRRRPPPCRRPRLCRGRPG